MADAGCVVSVKCRFRFCIYTAHLVPESIDPEVSSDGIVGLEEPLWSLGRDFGWTLTFNLQVPADLRSATSARFGRADGRLVQRCCRL